MQTILILGAGRSSIFLIRYLLDNAFDNDWEVIVADLSKKLAEEKINGHKRGKAVSLNIEQTEELEKLMDKSSLVISLLPPTLHIKAAQLCIKYKRNLLTASYTSPEMLQLNEEVKKNGLLFLNETGLDPGIDHMSAMQVIHRLKDQGSKILSFKSYCGGLIAPESDDNPWGYKFTWNPKNIVLAGQGVAKYLEDQCFKYIPYQQLFKRIERINFDALGEFEGYINRDSLKYQEAYELMDVQTLIRGTLRKSGFCKAWDAFVQLGMTDDSYEMSSNVKLTKKDFTKSFLPTSALPVRKNLAHFLNIPSDDEAIEKLKWLGLFEDDKIETSEKSPAGILLSILEKKWALQPKDRDLIVMQHQFIYEEEGKRKILISSLVNRGEDQEKTAMAKTVGLPLAIAAKLALNNEISQKGIIIPTDKEIYEPVLKELRMWGIHFKEETKLLSKA